MDSGNRNSIGEFVGVPAKERSSEGPGPHCGEGVAASEMRTASATSNEMLKKLKLSSNVEIVNLPSSPDNLTRSHMSLPVATAIVPRRVSVLQ